MTRKKYATPATRGRRVVECMFSMAKDVLRPKGSRMSDKHFEMLAGFHELESEDIEQVLASHTEKLTNEDLQLLTEHSASENDDDEETAQRTRTTKRMAEAFNMIQQSMQVLTDDDPNKERKFINIKEN
ncbi:putative Tigger transposable element-derived protein 1-like 220 [Homarus americanus]|uniref:Putative Tigger transposable element-derived protein 1-like 220 n=1 Tax=Homarus americanus TaxID=6706 RepID=A0A8J5TIV1_HOMAM|nr:putative Tigger transposable element-derived protein 1-like 220 [Homarus americanus]